MTDQTTPTLSDADLFAWAVVCAYQSRQAAEGIRLLLIPFPPCPTCQQTVTEVFQTHPLEVTGPDRIRLTMKPCGHAHALGDEALDRIQGAAEAVLRRMEADGSWNTDKVIEYAGRLYPSPAPDVSNVPGPQPS